MRPRQEQVVFLVVLALVGAMGARLLTSKPGRGPSSKGGQKPELVHYSAPDVSAVVPPVAKPQPGARALFFPPRDTRPLPPLALVEPPRDDLPALLPPTDPGPAPRQYGRWLRRRLAVQEMPGLFVAEEAPAEVATDVDAEAPGKPAPKDAAPRDGAREALRKLGYAGQQEKSEKHAAFDETPAAREARIAAYKQRYDWIQETPAEPIFGRIQNPARFALKADPARAGEPLVFVRLDP